MKETMCRMIRNSAIDKFASKYPEIDNMNVEMCLYLLDGTEEMFVIKCEHSNLNTIIFKYDCGELYEIRSEKDTFSNYLVRIPMSEASEFRRY